MLIFSFGVFAQKISPNTQMALNKALDIYESEGGEDVLDLKEIIFEDIRLKDDLVTDYSNGQPPMFVFLFREDKNAKDHSGMSFVVSYYLKSDGKGGYAGDEYNGLPCDCCHLQVFDQHLFGTDKAPLGVNCAQCSLVTNVDYSQIFILQKAFNYPSRWSTLPVYIRLKYANSHDH